MLPAALRPFCLLLFCWMAACQPEPKTPPAGLDSIPDTVHAPVPPPPARTLTGAELLLRDRLADLQGKRVALVANHTAVVHGRTHLADTLMSLGVSLIRVFSPEHGFRGQADAGEAVQSSTDERTGLPVVSLYGNNKKPSPAQMAGIDLLLFDMQDIGSRHYTYISTLTYVLEACAELRVPVLVLDRPNPNGWYTAGPVLEPGAESFIGMHRIPIVHGMTIGEYALMVNGEGWLKNGVRAELEVLACERYTHAMRWEQTGLPWVPPSPNIGSPYAAYLYPILCWYEPTAVGVGRGTHQAFEQIGSPWIRPERIAGDSAVWNGLTIKSAAFTPVSLPGKAKTPKFQDQACRGFAFAGAPAGDSLMTAGLRLLTALQQQHQAAGLKGFFEPAFYKWAGNRTLQQQVQRGLPPAEIQASWMKGLEAFRAVRSRYLVYPEG
ncbi:MAG: DUF1343 domain-containing protein [Bacteroidia bacterium]|nr:DUF1343 domain-containing protein [Bacteroidia bacterium]